MTEAQWPGEAATGPMRAVEEFAGAVLERGLDRWSPARTPLFADGCQVATWEPVEWVRDGRHHIVSNFASQQNLMRTLVGLSRITGDDRYRRAAREATAFMFERFRSPCGLLYWGGHTFVDLRTLEVVHIEGPRHEIKMHLPYYELLWEVDSGATARFIRAYWSGNMHDWRRLELNRHADYGQPPDDLWASEWDDPEPLYETTHHGSVMPLSDMTWSAAMLHMLSGGAEKSLPWARRMALMLARARHPETGLGAAKFTVLLKQQEVPEHLKESRQATFTIYGDRAQSQFGAEFGPAAIEPWQLWGVLVRRIYFEYSLAQMAIFEQLGESGREFLDWTVEGLKAWANHAYDPASNHFRAMWGDGTDMTGYVVERFGSNSEVGTVIEATPADPCYLLAYARAWRLSADADLWTTAREIARGNGLGDIGAPGGEGVELNPATDCSDPLALLALLELHRGTGRPVYLPMAGRIGENIVTDRFHNSLFISGATYRYARFDALEPLALLTLEAAMRGKIDAVPSFIGGLHRYLQGPADGHERTTDHKLFYQLQA
ncbi:MAG: pectate lyase [Armatimonadota bacterium]|jgi:pectate lyase